MADDAFEKRRQGLEEEFFKRQSQALKEKLKATLDKEQSRESLKQLTGITDDKVIDTLVGLRLSHDTFAAFGLYPLVEVAWADGGVDERERQAFLTVAAENGITPGSPAHAILEQFLKETPREDARRAWFSWTKELNQKLSPEERTRVRDALVKRAREIAEASGGVLGLGRKISPKEQAVLERIAQAFD